jgi:predicted nucleic acid-binding Zn ribbon protein
MLDTAHLHCPYCGEAFQTGVDPSEGEAEYIEDCPVCCRPIRLRLYVGEDGRIERVDAERSD